MGKPILFEISSFEKLNLFLYSFNFLIFNLAIIYLFICELTFQIIFNNFKLTIIKNK